MKQRVLTTFLGGRGGTSDSLELPGYNCESIVVNLLKIDAGSTGAIFASNWLLKPFTYDAHLLHNDRPNAAYLWLPPDNGTIAHEAISGGAMTISGAGAGISGSTAGVARYVAQFGMLPPTNSATIPASGLSYLTFSEINAQSWSWEAWLFRAGTTANNVYFETNAGSTVFASILIDAAGHVNISHSGALAFTSAAVLPLSAWTHVGITYSAAGASIALYFNGVLQGTAAYTRTTYAGIASIVWNANPGAGTEYVSLGAVYNNVALSADDYLRHYIDLAVDEPGSNFLSTAATIAKGQGVNVLFTNGAQQNYLSNNMMITLPLAPINLVQNTGGIFYVEVLFNEYEE
jgi:hypothetical protein